MPPADAEYYRTTLRQELPALAERFGVASLRLFGSFVRRENRPDSDLDVLVSFVDPPGLLGFVELENHLSDLLGVKVDLVMREALKPHLGQRVLAEVVPV
jgi:predicted nucleotidyltransferase